MMRLTVVAVGRLREPFWREAAAEYEKRLRPYATLEVVELPDQDISGDRTRAIEREGAAILSALPERARVIALDERGKGRGSVEFSERLQELALSGESRVTFVVGGSAGLSGAVLERADERMSLSPMTLPHQLARVVLLEQVYRALKIAKGEPYHL
jgi:23S rRNA (pseudouridine1915-N3)-methyltransferase